MSKYILKSILIKKRNMSSQTNNTSKSNKSYNQISLLSNKLIHRKNSNRDSKKGYPKYEINSSNTGVADVTITLNPDQKIVADGGAMSFMSGNISMETSAKNGFFSGLARAISGESFFLNEFYVKDNRIGKITCSSVLPGDVVCMEIAAGKSVYLAPGSYICSTVNTRISAHRRLRGVFFGDGLALTEVTATEDRPALVWVGAFGAVKEIKVDSDREFVVDNGMFFACNSGVDFDISKVGGLKSLFFSGEGIVMRFKGQPGRKISVFTQSRSIGSFASFLSPMISKK